jgi:hypothetical protein
MVLGEKLFEEKGNVIGVKITKVNPVEGVTTELVSHQKLGAKAGFQTATILPRA